MADYGIKITSGGNDTQTQDRSVISFSSEYILFKQEQTGTVTLSVPLNSSGNYISTPVVIAHGLGYRPAVGAFWSADGGVNWRACGSRGPLFSPSMATQVASDATNLYFSAITANGSGPMTLTFRWISYVDGVS